MIFFILMLIKRLLNSIILVKFGFFQILKQIFGKQCNIIKVIEIFDNE